MLTYPIRHGGNVMDSSIAALQARPVVKDPMQRPLRDLRISVIDRCNYRCPYCMPEEVFGEAHEFLPRKDWLTPGEIKRVASLFLKLGVTKLRLTGGEPVRLRPGRKRRPEPSCSNRPTSLLPRCSAHPCSTA